MNNIGEGSGKYYNINIPWDVDRTNPPNTSSYLYAFDSLICPVLKEFNPDMIFVSCGFDAGKGDPLGGCEVDKIGFALMTSKLMKI
jgi:acetoin utilization deacetylase AcuC-like enzyme